MTVHLKSAGLFVSINGSLHDSSDCNRGSLAMSGLEETPRAAFDVLLHLTEQEEMFLISVLGYWTVTPHIHASNARILLLDPLDDY